MANFLDLRCPACGGEDRIDIRADVWIRACDDQFAAPNSRRRGTSPDGESRLNSNPPPTKGVLHP
jgi:hypothetical protein